MKAKLVIICLVIGLLAMAPVYGLAQMEVNLPNPDEACTVDVDPETGEMVIKYSSEADEVMATADMKEKEDYIRANYPAMIEVVMILPGMVSALPNGKTMKIDLIYIVETENYTGVISVGYPQEKVHEYLIRAGAMEIYHDDYGRQYVKVTPSSEDYSELGAGNRVYASIERKQSACEEKA